MTVVVAETGQVVPTLASCEAVIERGLASFLEVGEALVTIRDEKLYRRKFDTFEAYCMQRWGLRRRRAYELIGAAEVVGALSSIDDTPLPANEAQARALRPVKNEPEKAAEAMRQATEATAGEVTAAAIADAVEAVIEAAEAKAEQRAEDAAAAKEMGRLAAKAGLDLDPDRLRQRGEFARLCTDIAALPAPAEFIANHGAALKGPDADRAIKAFEWLQSFVYCWENR